MTADVVVAPAGDLDPAEVLALYRAVGWTAYDPAALLAGIAGSSRVVAARRDGALVGLARVVSDGATICYLQDVLVRPDEQRRGTGRALVRAALVPYGSVRTVLLTDDEPGQHAFYSSLGFRPVRDDGPLRAFVRLARQPPGCDRFR